MSGEIGLEDIDRMADMVVFGWLMPGLSGGVVLEEIPAEGYDYDIVIASNIEPPETLILFR